MGWVSRGKTIFVTMPPETRSSIRDWGYFEVSPCSTDTIVEILQDLLHIFFFLFLLFIPSHYSFDITITIATISSTFARSPSILPAALQSREGGDRRGGGGGGGEFQRSDSSPGSRPSSVLPDLLTSSPGQRQDKSTSEEVRHLRAYSISLSLFISLHSAALSSVSWRAKKLLARLTGVPAPAGIQWLLHVIVFLQKVSIFNCSQLQVYSRCRERSHRARRELRLWFRYGQGNSWGVWIFARYCDQDPHFKIKTVNPARMFSIR